VASSSCVYDGGGRQIQLVDHNEEQHTDGKKINDVAYQLYCPEWKQRYRLIHVDKLKLCTPATQPLDSVASQPTTHFFVVIAGGPIAHKADLSGIDGLRSWKAR